MDHDLFVEIFVPTLDEGGRSRTGGAGAIGTAYPISETLVLTARHVVRPGPGRPARDPDSSIQVRWHVFQDATPDGGWYSIEDDAIVWCGAGDLDAALVRVPRPPEARGHLDLTDIVPQAHMPYEAAGFPRGGRRNDRRTKLSFSGTMEAMGAQDRTFDVYVTRDFRAPRGWCGASGMPIVHDDKIIGLAAEVPTGMTNSLTCIPACRLLADAGFREELSRDKIRRILTELEQERRLEQESLAQERLEAEEVEVYLEALQKRIGKSFGRESIPQSAAAVVDMISHAESGEVQKHFNGIRQALRDVTAKLHHRPSDRAAVERAVAALYFLAACRLVDGKACGERDLLVRVPYEKAPLVCAIIAASLFGGHLDIWCTDERDQKVPEYYFELSAQPGSEHLAGELDRALYKQLRRKFPDVMEASLEAGALTEEESAHLKTAINTVRLTESALTLVIRGLSNTALARQFVEKHELPALIEDSEEGTDLLGMPPKNLIAEIQFFMRELKHWPEIGRQREQDGKAQPSSPAGPPDGDGPSR